MPKRKQETLQLEKALANLLSVERKGCLQPKTSRDDLLHDDPFRKQKTRASIYRNLQSIEYTKRGSQTRAQH